MKLVQSGRREQQFSPLGLQFSQREQGELDGLHDERNVLRDGGRSEIRDVPDELHDEQHGLGRCDEQRLEWQLL